MPVRSAPPLLVDKMVGDEVHDCAEQPKPDSATGPPLEVGRRDQLVGDRAQQGAGAEAHDQSGQAVGLRQRSGQRLAEEE